MRPQPVNQLMTRLLTDLQKNAQCYFYIPNKQTKTAWQIILVWQYQRVVTIDVKQTKNTRNLNIQWD